MATDLAHIRNDAASLQSEISLGSDACKHILLVDDSASAVQVLARLLGMLGHRVAFANDGETAVAAALKLQPQMIVLDLNLPDVSGFDLARVLRKHSSLQGTLLVALTGLSDEETRAAAEVAGFDEFIVKPAGIEVFEELLEHPKLASFSEPHRTGLSPR